MFAYSWCVAIAHHFVECSPLSKGRKALSSIGATSGLPTKWFILSNVNMLHVAKSRIYQFLQVLEKLANIGDEKLPLSRQQKNQRFSLKTKNSTSSEA
jgi:hypothetical protein